MLVRITIPQLTSRQLCILIPTSFYVYTLMLCTAHTRFLNLHGIAEKRKAMICCEQLCIILLHHSVKRHNLTSQSWQISFIKGNFSLNPPLFSLLNIQQPPNRASPPQTRNSRSIAPTPPTPQHQRQRLHPPRPHLRNRSSSRNGA